MIDEKEFLNLKEKYDNLKEKISAMKLQTKAYGYPECKNYIGYEWDDIDKRFEEFEKTLENMEVKGR